MQNTRVEIIYLLINVTLWPKPFEHNIKRTDKNCTQTKIILTLIFHKEIKTFLMRRVCEKSILQRNTHLFKINVIHKHTTINYCRIIQSMNSFGGKLVPKVFLQHIVNTDDEMTMSECGTYGTKNFSIFSVLFPKRMENCTIQCELYTIITKYSSV